MLIYLSLRQLEMFRTVARLKSFSRAAEALNISQSALSQAIIQTETMLGAQLFVRTKRSVATTPAAERFLPRVEQLLADYRDALIELQADDDPSRGRVSVACLASVATHVVLSAVQEFRRRYPQALVQVFDDHPDGIVERVKSGRVDMAVSCLFERDTDVQAIPLLQDRFYAVCRSDHPMATAQSVGWGELQQYDFVAMAKGTGVRSLIDNGLPIGTIHENVTYEVARVPSVLEIVGVTNSVSAVPALALESGGSVSHLTRIPLQEPEIWREISLIVRRGEELSASARAFRDVLVDILLKSSWQERPGIRIVVPKKLHPVSISSTS